MPTKLSPAEAWQSMIAGNQRFISGNPEHPNQDGARRTELQGSQHPVAALFGCSDSRLAAEIIFDKGLGDLFVVRNAGQTVSDSVLGSLEYAVSVLQVPLIMVLGHDECGAIRATMEQLSPEAEQLSPSVQSIIDKIMPAALRVQKLNPTNFDSQEIAKEHLRDTVKELMSQSEVITQAIAADKLAIVGANYQLLHGLAIPDFVIGNIELD